MTRGVSKGAVVVRGVTVAKAKIVDNILRTKFAGYCGACGCMLGEHDDGCPKCGSELVTMTAPKPPLPPPGPHDKYSPYGDHYR